MYRRSTSLCIFSRKINKRHANQTLKCSGTPQGIRTLILIEKKIEVINKLGLHARAAAKLVGVANHYSSNITLDNQGKTANAKSIMTVMMLGAAKGTTLDVSCEGKDETEAMQAIETIFNNYFDEGE